MKRLFGAQIPLWAVLLAVFGMCVGMLAVFSIFRVQIFRYTLALPPDAARTETPLSYGEQPAFSDPDFFKKTKDDFIEQKANFLEADLSEMRLSLYEAGTLATTVPILTKGKEGSWWETPAGIYKIAAKERNHFSTFGKVYQPWSMSFQGNFFIHGWPYYPDGTFVASTYSGGCIRLADPDAETIYGMAKVGMPVLVFKSDFVSDEFQYQTRIPEITASRYLAADIQNNFVFLEKNKTEPVPLGDFSELLAALVATDYLNIEKKITLDEEKIDSVSSGSRFVSGETVTPYDLLHPMLLASDKDAMKIFGNIFSEKRFASLVNDKSTAVGMKKTEFLTDASGETNAEDLFYLAKYLYHSRKFILDISAGRRTNTAYGVSRFSTVPNENLFANDKSFVGGKAVNNEDGTTSFFGVFEISVRAEKRPILIFLMNSQNAKDETQNIMDYIRRSYD